MVLTPSYSGLSSVYLARFGILYPVLGIGANPMLLLQWTLADEYSIFEDCTQMHLGMERSVSGQWCGALMPITPTMA